MYSKIARTKFVRSVNPKGTITRFYWSHFRNTIFPIDFLNVRRTFRRYDKRYDAHASIVFNNTQAF